MNKIEKTIGNLNSSNKNTRYEACEELSTAGSLPESAIIALESATNDPDPLVADAARRALAIHKPSPPTEEPLSFSRDLPLQEPPRNEKVESILEQKPLWPRILIIPVVMLLCILIPIAGDMFIEFGKGWEKIPPPPAKSEELLVVLAPGSGEDIILFIKTEDDKIYRISNNTNEWVLEPAAWEADEDVTCNFSIIKFLSWKRPFSNSYECMEAEGAYDSLLPIPESYPVVTYVLDKDGNIWMWEGDKNSFRNCLLLLCASSGFFIGLLVFSKKSRKPKAAKTSSQLFNSR
jgi:hypothetical protein